jgi:hypothetical protein
LILSCSGSRGGFGAFGRAARLVLSVAARRLGLVLVSSAMFFLSLFFLFFLFLVFLLLLSSFLGFCFASFRSSLLFLFAVYLDQEHAPFNEKKNFGNWENESLIDA